MFIIKLKIILQSKYFYFLLLLITILFVLCKIFILEKNSLYQDNETNFILKIDNIKENKTGVTITFIGKEKLISHYYQEFPYQLGDIVQINGVLKRPSKNTIPNLFNYQEYLHNQEIFYILEINKITLLKENNNLLYKSKTSIINLINKYESKKYLHAFILGNTSYIDNNIKNMYIDLGISHLFAISGMHVSLLLAIITYILNKLKFNKYLSFILITLFLSYYVFLVNFQVSIIRSVLSYIFLSLNKFLKLEIKNIYILILVLVIALFLNPFNIYHLGFQYSYLISFVLMKYSYLIKGNYLKKTFLVSFIAFLSSMPITIMNNCQINLLSVLFNLIYVPLVSIIIFPFALICIVIPFLDNILLFLTNLLESMTIFLNDFSIILIMKKTSLLIVGIYFILIFYMLDGISKRKYYRILYLIVLLVFHYNINYFIKDNYLIMLDVGQGDSILIHNMNKTFLIDTGGSINKDYSDDIITFMKSMGIQKVNYLFLTHGDLDHLGSSYNLVNNFKVENVVFNNDSFNDLEIKLIKELKKRNIPFYQNIKKLDVLNNKFYFLNNRLYDNENDNSIVLYTILGNYKFLFMGDAGVDVEKVIIEKYDLSNIDVLKVGHHGSKTSSDIEFINHINPKYSIIGVGKNNRYNHPNKDVLNNLQNSKIYRTDQDGSIMFKIENNKLKIETYAS